jgi:hypothetical protein
MFATMIGKLLRLYGYLFSGVLCLGMTGLGLFVLMSGSNNFAVELIPWWTGRELAQWLAVAGAVGLAITALVASGRMPVLMLLWMAVVFGTMVYGFYLSGYRYNGWEEFKSSLYWSGGALAALLGAISGVFATSSKRS